MYHFCLDTCTWIYLANGTEPVVLLDYIKDEVEKGNIKIVVPEIIITEWNRNKEEAVEKNSVIHFKKTLEELKRISQLLGSKGTKPFTFLFEDEDKTDYFEDIIKKLKDKREEIKEVVGENIKRIDEIFNHPSTIKLKITDAVKLNAADLALNKLAPFTKNKNNFADAIIFLSFYNHVLEQKLENTFFVTYNIEDFCDPPKKRILHPELQPYINRSKTKFYTIVGEALKTIKEDLITKETIELIREQQDSWDFEEDEYSCELCHDSDGNSYPVYFDAPIKLYNEEVIEEDADQLEFGFSKDLPKTSFSKPPTTIQVGHCCYCNTEHLKCQSCGEVTAVGEDDYNKKIECDGCGTAYYIERTTDRKGIDEKIYKIPRSDLFICQVCGEDFIDEDNNNNEICPECEEKYARGE